MRKMSALLDPYSGQITGEKLPSHGLPKPRPKKQANIMSQSLAEIQKASYSHNWKIQTNYQVAKNINFAYVPAFTLATT